VADFAMAFWAGASFELLRDVPLAVAGKYRLYVVLYYDGGVVRPAAFSAMQDALTT